MGQAEGLSHLTRSGLSLAAAECSQRVSSGLDRLVLVVAATTGVALTILSVATSIDTWQVAVDSVVELVWRMMWPDKGPSWTRSVWVLCCSPPAGAVAEIAKTGVTSVPAGTARLLAIASSVVV